jgi:hypothetical protein
MKKQNIKQLKKIQKGPGFHLVSTTGRRTAAEVIGRTRLYGERVYLIKVER